MIKQGKFSFNVVFKGTDAYTNKLFACNAKLVNDPARDTLQVDFSHYSKKKRNNLEDTDYARLVKQQEEISHFLIDDETVKKAFEDNKIIKVTIILSDSSSVSVSVSTLDKASGILR